MVKDELNEITRLLSMLNSIAGQLKQAKKDCEVVITRVEASRNSINNVTEEINKRLSNIRREIKEE